MNEWQVDPIPNGVIIEGRIIPAAVTKILEDKEYVELEMPLENQLTAVTVIPLTEVSRGWLGMEEGMEARASMMLFWGDWKEGDIDEGGGVHIDLKTGEPLRQTNASAAGELVDIYEVSEIFDVMAKWGSLVPIDSARLRSLKVTESS